MTLVLADTSIWVAHFRTANPVLQSLVAMDQVLCHPLIVLELACGTPPAPRERTLGDLNGRGLYWTPDRLKGIQGKGLVQPAG